MSRFWVSLAFDFDWEACLLVEQLGAQNQGGEQPPETALQTVCAEWPRAEGEIRYHVAIRELEARKITRTGCSVSYFKVASKLANSSTATSK